MTSSASEHSQPQPTLGLREAVAIIVGIVIGAGIFKAPSLVAQFTGSPGWMLAAWVAGGVISFIGALCYAELAAAWPHAGGDYHFLQRAYGRRVSFLFAWARFSVITTGSIALLAFVFGDYMSALLPLGSYSAAIWGALAILALTWVNARGISASASTQSWLTLAEVLGLVLIVAAGLWLWLGGEGAAPVAPIIGEAAASATSSTPSMAMLGLAMVFVLLTYGGWNEAAYLSAELRGSRRSMLHALGISLALITVLYLAVNLAYLYGLGIQGMAKSEAVAADLLRVAFGRTGETLISLAVAVAALTSINATMIVGSRTNFAVGRDWPALHALGRWHPERGVPAAALYAQSAFALALVVFGGSLRSGFQVMVDYTAPVFWTFFFLCAIALIVLRVREPQTPRPFKVPLYPVLPLLFASVCLYMLWSSLAYVKAGALAGVGVLVIGGVLLWVLERKRTQEVIGSS
ncbi:APC family permease [Ottowia thiooxydans]|uniref:APC family permease n=1 Tax=Ottowia thiooxydans TaxID=219182 RepID=UPI0004168EC4|nr:amino acid permease [Ottowia thiooxydans]